MKRLACRITLLLLSLFPIAAAGQQSCPAAVYAMVDKVLPPEVGDPDALADLLDPAIARPQLGAVFNARTAAHAVGDHALNLDRCSCDPPEAEADRSFFAFLHGLVHRLKHRFQHLENCTYSSPSGGELRTREREGRYTYVNPSRSHRGVEVNSIEQQDAAEWTLKALRKIGVPEAEIDYESSQVRDVNLYAQNLDAGSPSGAPLIVRAEVHPMFLRHVGGTAVWDSFASAAINTRGQIARLHIRWPDFCITPGVTAAHTLDSDEVRRRIAARILANNPCELVDRVGARLAYVESDALEGPLTAAQSGPEDSEAEPRTCYLPAVVIAVFGPEPQVNPRQVSLGGELIAVPLFSAAATDDGAAT